MIRTVAVSSCAKGKSFVRGILRTITDSNILKRLFSTLLKSDQWLGESHHVEHGVRGAINFRQVPDSDIYALGQPTIEAIDEVVDRIKITHPYASKIVWVTLREEPIVYINGAPYCLRRENYSLRNMKGD